MNADFENLTARLEQAAKKLEKKKWAALTRAVTQAVLHSVTQGLEKAEKEG